MSNMNKLVSALQSGDYSQSFAALYPPAQAKKQPERFLSLAECFTKNYGEPTTTPRLFSSPGRTEVGGNHTDHQNGRVLAAAVNMDAVAIAAKNDLGVIRLQSVGYSEDIVDIEQLELNPEETNRSIAIIRGICARLDELGYAIGGFDAYTTSNVPGGSGLSSSAAFENLVTTILNHFYNDGSIDAVTTAQVGQYAENEYFGKPSGLLDQATSSVGGFITIDFAEEGHPVVEPVDFDFAAANHALCIVNTGGDHANLTDEYAAVSNDMSDVAAYFGKDVLRQVEETEFYQSLSEIREKTSDRAVLRAMHFFGDNARVPQQVAALRSNAFDSFKEMVIASGHSSFMQLQNVYSCAHPLQQGLSVALALSEKTLAPVGGAWRVHGGGFAGTIQAFVPLSSLEAYKATMDAVFGEGACQELVVRSVGATEITK